MDTPRERLPRGRRPILTIAGLMALVLVAAILFLPLVPMSERAAVAYCLKMGEIAHPGSEPAVVATSWKPESRSWYVRLGDRDGRIAHCEVGTGYLSLAFSIAYEYPSAPNPGATNGPGGAAGPDEFESRPQPGPD